MSASHDGERESRIVKFLADFGKRPEGPAREIPEKWRMPLFLGMIVVGVIALALIGALVIAPALKRGEGGAGGAKPSATMRPSHGPSRAPGQ
jgi:hypothetical protein